MSAAYLTLWDSGQANTIKMAIAGVTPHTLYPRHEKTNVPGYPDSFILSGVESLIDIGEGICIANDWEYRRS